MLDAFEAHHHISRDDSPALEEVVQETKSKEASLRIVFP